MQIRSADYALKRSVTSVRRWMRPISKIIIIIIIVHLRCAYYKKDIGALQSNFLLRNIIEIRMRISVLGYFDIFIDFRKSDE